MSIDREAIGNALYAQLTASGMFGAGSGRKFKPYSAAGGKPALLLRDGEELTERPAALPRGLPPVQVFAYEVWLYADPAGATTPNAGNLNPLVSAVDLALQPGPASEVITLGGLVQHCWIEGKTIKDVSDTVNQPTAVVPVLVKVVANPLNQWAPPSS